MNEKKGRQWSHGEGSGGSLIERLQSIQQEYGFLPEEALRELASLSGRTLLEIFQVATFYKAFTFAPRGKHHITACCGTACHVRGSAKVVKEISRNLGVAPGGTTADGLFSLETANCLGACALAPLVVVDGNYHAHMTPAKALTLMANPGDLVLPGDTEGPVAPVAPAGKAVPA